MCMTLFKCVWSGNEREEAQRGEKGVEGSLAGRSIVRGGDNRREKIPVQRG